MLVNVSKEKITSDFHHRNVPLSSELAPEHTGKTDEVTLWGWVLGAEASSKREELKKRRPSFPTGTTAVKPTDWSRLAMPKSACQHFLSEVREFACWTRFLRQNKGYKSITVLSPFDPLNIWSSEKLPWSQEWCATSCTASADALMPLFSSWNTVTVWRYLGYSDPENPRQDGLLPSETQHNECLGVHQVNIVSWVSPVSVA